MQILLLLLIIVALIIGWKIVPRFLAEGSIATWKWRRRFQLLVLAMPVLLLSTGIGGMHSLIQRLCPSVIAAWDTWSGTLFPLMLCAVALGALGWGSIRLMFMIWWLKKQHVLADAKLQTTVDTLAQRYTFPSVRVWLTRNATPLALTTGIIRPQIVLSTWMIQHLNQDEIEAVLAHELEHVVRRDYLFAWIAIVLRDAFFYLPASRRIYRQMQMEKELMCDQQVVQKTHRPLALASALTKVWLHAVESIETPQLHMAQPLTGRHAEIKMRVERLLSLSSASRAKVGQMERREPGEVAMLGTSFCLQGITILLVMILMGCIPLFLLDKLF
jgi:hypothetical protein